MAGPALGDTESPDLKPMIAIPSDVQRVKDQTRYTTDVVPVDSLVRVVGALPVIVHRHRPPAGGGGTFESGRWGVCAGLHKQRASAPLWPERLPPVTNLSIRP